MKAHPHPQGHRQDRVADALARAPLAPAAARPVAAAAAGAGGDGAARAALRSSSALAGWSKPCRPTLPTAGADWSAWDISGALRLLRSGSLVVVHQTLRKLHVRWWHCTAERMRSLLQAAGVPDEVAQKARQVCETCTVFRARAWFRPTAEAIASVRISEHFNWAVQVDLIFIGDFAILHMICECFRWAQAKEIANRETSTVFSAIVDLWFRIWGPPKLFISDGEGALDSEEGGVFCERWGSQRKVKAPGQHAHLIERHRES